MVKIFQFLRPSTKFLAVLRLSVNPIETLFYHISMTYFFAYDKIKNGTLHADYVTRNWNESFDIRDISD